MQLDAPSTFISGLVDALPTSFLHQFTALRISGGAGAYDDTRSRGILDKYVLASVAAQALKAVTNLVELSIVQIQDDDAPRLLEAVRNLPLLKQLATEYWDGFVSPLLALP